MTCSPTIPRYEKAPETDEEWEDALKHYGYDRDDPPARPPNDPSSSTWLTSGTSHSSPACTPGPSSNRLVHQDDATLDETSGGCKGSPTRLPFRMDKNAGRNVNSRGPFDQRLELAGEKENLLSTAAMDRGSSRGSAASEDTEARSIYTSNWTEDKPGHDTEEGEDSRSGDAERRRLREFFDREGWLPGPRPSKKTNVRRKRAIRNLGLGVNDEAPERKAVISKYAEMAKQIFNTSTAIVSIIRDGEETMYSTDPDADPIVIVTEEGGCAHSVVHRNEQCTVIADSSKDWRFARNPLRAEGVSKFYASAPLRVRSSKDAAVEIGTICVLDTSPRDTFDQREQGILLGLAEMLVYQLTTLQSEIVAKSSSSMYEAIIAFLRRSVMPENKRRSSAPKRKESVRLARDSSFAPRERPAPSQNASAADVRPHSPVVLDDPIMAVKTGPRDSKDAKRHTLLMDRELFTDVASTLRRILQADAVAVVNLDEYQLFVRTNSTDDDRSRSHSDKSTKEDVVADFLMGKPWPARIEPVVNYVPRTNGSGVQLLGTDSDLGQHFHFHQEHSEATLGEFLRKWLHNGHFWLDRKEKGDDVSRRLLSLMPEQCQTMLATALLTHDGKPRFASFVSWNRPPSAFNESNTVALPGASILGGIAMAALAIRKVRSLEQSQISYSNLQAHELRTPLHQILAITQLLRSSMNDLAEVPHQLTLTNINCLTTTQQIRDLLPFLDAIDTSGKTLHGIVDNILSFLDLKANDNMIAASSVQNPSPSLLNSPSGATQSLEVLFEELVHEAWDEDKRSRRANGQPLVNIETVFEIIPPLLGEKVTEDTGGALRRALAKILSNAYKFIDSEGCVEIYVDDVPCLLPPEGCEDLSTSRRIIIKIADNGRGMEQSFVREKLGEPWAKEDPYTTGSGLSVHLAYRIIDLMGGQMEISSAPGRGCTVQIEVPLPRRHISLPSSPNPESPEPVSPIDPIHLAAAPDEMHIERKVGLAGFDLGPVGTYGLERLQTCLERQYRKLGCEIVPIEEADLVMIDGRQEENASGAEYIRQIKTGEIVFLVTHDHEPDPSVVAVERELGKNVRRFRKPATPSTLRESLFPGHLKAIQAEIPTADGIHRTPISSPDQVDANGHDVHSKGQPKAHFDDDSLHRPRCRPSSLFAGLSQLWKPKNMPMEDAVASLCLGDYFSSRRRTSLVRITSNASSGPESSADPTTPTIASIESGDAPQMASLSQSTSVETDSDPELLKVLVVEDNAINRKILVKILSSKISVDIYEAEDGCAAVEQFKDFTGPAIVLLDINMPKMDGYQACLEMRAIEKAMTQRGRSQIIAVTALGGEAEKRRGLVESGMDSWFTKPCGKATIHKAVEEARKLLLGIEEAVGIV